MSLFIFTKAIFEGKQIKLYNKGDMVRDFTYIDDVTEAIFKLVNISTTKIMILRIILKFSILV